MYDVDSWWNVKKFTNIIVHCVNKVECYLKFHINNLKLLKKRVTFYVSGRCNLWTTFSTCYQTLIQLMLEVNSWKVVKRMIKQYYHYCKESKVEIFSTLELLLLL